MEEVDEYGIPIKKQQTATEVDEFGIPIKKKVPITSASSNGSSPTPPTSGSGVSQFPAYSVKVDEGPMRKGQPSTVTVGGKEFEVAPTPELTSTEVKSTANKLFKTASPITQTPKIPPSPAMEGVVKQTDEVAISNLSPKAASGNEDVLTEYISTLNEEDRNKLRSTKLNDEQSFEILTKAYAPRLEQAVIDLSILRDRGVENDLKAIDESQKQMQSLTQSIGADKTALVDLQATFLKQKGYDKVSAEYKNINKQLQVSQKQITPILQEQQQIEDALKQFEPLIQNGSFVGSEQEYAAYQEAYNAYEQISNNPKLAAYNNLVQKQNEIASNINSMVTPEYKAQEEKLLNKINSSVASANTLVQNYQGLLTPEKAQNIELYKKTIDEYNAITNKLQTAKSKMPDVIEKEAYINAMNAAVKDNPYLKAFDLSAKAIGGFTEAVGSMLSAVPKFAGGLSNEYTFSDKVAESITNFFAPAITNTQTTTAGKPSAAYQSFYDSETDHINWSSLPDEIANQAGAFAVLAGSGVLGGMAKFSEVSSVVVPGALISYNDAYQTGREIYGDDAYSATAYATASSLITGITELIMPDRDILTGGSVDKMARNYVANYVKKGKRFAIERSLVDLTEMMGKEVAEEFADRWKDVLLKGVVNMTGGDIENDIPTLNEQLSIAASTAALTGGLGAFSQRGKNSKARQLAVYQSAKSYPETLTMLNTMEAEGYDADRIDAIKSEVTNMFVTLKEVPADLSAPKRIAIAEKLNTIKRIEDAMASGISPFIADKMNDSIKKISDDIQNIILDPKYDEAFGKEVNEEIVKSESAPAQVEMPVIEITPTTEEIIVEGVETPTEEIVATETPVEPPAQSEAVKEDTTIQTPTTDEKRNEEGRQKGLLTNESEAAVEVPTKESVTEKLSISNPFYKNVEGALVKLGLIEKYNPETKSGDVVGGYVQGDGDGGFASGDMYFKADGSISYVKNGVIVTFDKDGNIISENTKEAAEEALKIKIQGAKDSISFLEQKRDSDDFRYKEVTETDAIGNRKKVKKLKSPQELKDSTDKINAVIDKAKAELSLMATPAQSEAVKEDTTTPTPTTDGKETNKGSQELLTNESEAAETAQSTQKADVEKTLYGTISGSIPLSQALPNGVYVDLGDGLFAYADKGDKIAAIVDKSNGYTVSKSFWNDNTNTWQLPNQSNLKDDAKRFGVDEKTYIKKYQDAVNNLNAKYDAELIALNTPAQSEAVKEDTTTTPTPTTDEKRNEEGRQVREGLLTKKAEVTTNIPEAPPLTKVFVATSGNTIEENEMGNLVVKGKRGGILTGKERNKVIREYRKEKMTGGKRVTSADLERDNITEPEAVRYIAENSTSPEQLLEMMAVVEPKDAKLSGKDSFIADNMDAISAESWAKFGDTNRITPDIKKNFIRKNGTGIDQIAQAASYAMNPEGDGTEITPKDVIDFVEANQKGIKEALKAGNEDMKVLYDAFVSLTGRAPTRSMIADVKKEGADKRIEEDFGMEPEPQDFSVSDSPQMKKRRFTKQVMADKATKGTTKAKITEDAIYYLEQKNVISEAEARNTIRELGQEAADKIVRDPNSKINGGVRGMLTQILLRQYEEQGDADKFIDLQRWATMRLTEMGAEIQTYAKWGLLRADYTLEGSILDYEKATGEKVPEHLREKFKRIADEISSLEKKAKELRDKQAEKALGEATANIVESIGREEKKQPSAKKRQALSPEKTARKKALRSKFAGIFNDFTNIPKLLTDKEFIEYNKLILEEAAGDFKNFVKGIVEELGSKIRPYARELYKAAGGSELPELEKAYIDEEGKIKIPKEIIREVVLSGAKTADELVAGVLNIVQNELKGVTEREIKEAITEYGKTINPSKDQIEAEIRRLKRDGKLELGLEDAKSGKGVKRSGLQREKPSDYQRELMRKINEELKKYPQDQASVEKKWASALDRVKTHLKNTIADTQKRIQDIRDGIAEPLPSKKRGFELDEEAKALQEERDNLKKILAELEPKQEMSDETRVKVALAAAERAIAATADKINAQELEYKKKKEPLNTPELVAARERLKLGKDVLNRMREESGFAEQHRYDLWKKRIQKRITDLQEKIDNKDFSVAPKKVMEINQEILELRVKADKLKFERDVEIEKARIKSLEWLAKLTNKLVDLSGVPKSLMASGDLSAPLRQGAILGVRHPSLAYAAGKEMFKQMESEEAQENWLAALHESEVYPYMKHSKLFLSEPSVDLKAKEEQFLSNLADRIPIWGKYVVKPSGRAYNGYLNKLRADVFTQFYYALRQEGFSGAELEKELKAYAKFINVATGRGGLGPLEGIALVLNLAFFSPRFIASRIQMLNPYFYYTLGPRVGWYAFKSFATYIGVASMTLYLIAAMFGGDDDEDKFTVELDPRSSDFGKLRWGDIRYDIWAGEQGFVRLAAQFLSNSRKSTTTGEIIKLGEGYKPTTRFGLIGDFLMNKRAPVPTAVMNALNGVTNFGEPTTWSEEVLKLGIPIYSADMYELYQADQADKILGATIPSLLGVGVNFQNPNKKQPTTREEVQEEMNRRLEKKAEAEMKKEYRDNNPKIQEQKDKKEAEEDALYERAKKYGIEYVKK